MLGTKTRQVTAYGRRGHRIVNADDTDRRVDVKSDAGAVPRHRPDDTLATPPRLSRKSQPSYSSRASTPEVSSPESMLKTQALPRKADKAMKTKIAPGRAPLSMVPTNVLSGNGNGARAPPAQKPLQKGVKPRVVSGKKNATPKRKPLTMVPVSPVVHLDIITLDDKGKQVSVEKRKTNPAVPANPVARNEPRPTKGKAPAPKPVHRRPVEVIEISSSDEDVPAPRMRQPALKSRRPVVHSSDEDSDVEIISGGDSGRPLPAAFPPPGRSTAPKRRNVVLSSPESVPSPSSSRDTIRPSSRPAAAKPPRAPLARQPVEPARSRPSVQPPRQPLARPSRVSVDLDLQGRSKPRPSTPIRSRAFPAPPSPPSPTTPSDTDDLSLDLAELELSPRTLRNIEAEARGLRRAAVAQPAHLAPLLRECGQAAPHEFSAFIEMFPVDPLVQVSHDGVRVPGTGRAAFRKIGEASYSEVFGIGDVVLKIIPLRNEEHEKGKKVSEDVDCPAPSDVKDVLKEIIVTRAVGDVCEGFVELLRTYVVRGKYPSLLLDLWDEYDQRKGSESVRPDGFGVSQVYAIIVLPNGGPDLEAYTFTGASKNGWRQACSLFWQVTRALAEAEELVQFEHRDLHWGQILVKDTEDVPAPPRPKTGKVPMDDVSFGVCATIIDLGLSRMNAGDGDDAFVHWTSPEAEVFDGEGDYQFDVYRMMRAHSDGKWRRYRPLTNVMWLHYLADKLLHAKRLRKPAAGKAARPDARVFSELECHACLVEVEAALRRAVDACVPKKGNRKTQAPKAVGAGAFGCAGDVLEMAQKHGWVR
ncbi:serine/threonine-protein kinase haspin -like protein [Phanerochaete sordida]|uniref:non-specific serine/threonine protein kinase n=1 Tax=Phanerochaete sordida TaxID=48140 RepID=A0A9P3FXW4_9APHY|nr:serine/threonine-protein kinase haspin -like protein [Phanerochaete sordida]